MSNIGMTVQTQIELLDKFFLSRGYDKQRGGKSYVKVFHRPDGTDSKIRYKIQPRVVRKEVLCDETGDWVHLKSAKINEIRINENNKLVGFKWSVG